MRSALTLSLATVAAGYYKLAWLGDFQTGEWDKDAAENIAFDKETNRMFIASAETGVVKVADLTNPTLITEASTLNVGANLASYCNEVNCIYSGVDFGGEDNGCGYAKMTKYITNYGTLDVSGGVAYGPSGNMSMVPYVYGGGSSSTWAVDSTMTSPEACRTLCQDVIGSSHFSYEYEWIDSLSSRAHECFCKASFVPSDVPSGVTLDECNDHYTYWEIGSPSTMHEEDSTWVGAAGPLQCGKFQAESVQSVAVIHVPGYANSIVAAASPSKYPFANGYLTFYDAHTLNYLSCAEAGIAPEGITATPTGQVACFNEGKMSIQECKAGQVARNRCNDGDDFVMRSNELHVALDHQGSMTMCEIMPSSGSVSAVCSNYLFTSNNFADVSTGAQCANAYSFTVTAAGSVSDYTSSKIDSMKTSIANKAGVSVSKVSIDVQAGSVILKVTIRADTAAELGTIANAIEPELGSSSKATALFGGSSVVTIETVNTVPDSSNMLSSETVSELPAWGMVVIIAVVVMFVLVCGLICVMMKKEKEGKPIFQPLNIGTPNKARAAATGSAA